MRSVLSLVFLMLWSNFAISGELPKLVVSEDGRSLETENGEHFFYLGDTAWELFHRLSREEADRYLEDRASKGFNVIQAVGLAEINGLHAPNAYGHTPLIDDDPTRPDTQEGSDNDYWDHVDYCVKKANSLGMYVGFLPTWGDKWNLKWAANSKFNGEIFTPENAEAYGEWLGRRYKESGVIWILGGDRPVENDKHRAIIEAMAKGLKKGDGGSHLMTFHPSGSSSSTKYFPDADWLDFHMMQSGHSRPDKPNAERIAEDIKIAPKKPVLDGEPCYEDHPLRGRNNWDRRNEVGFTLQWFDEWDARNAGYRAVLAGACGHTYGNHNIWQMWQPGRDPITASRTPWTEALDHPGARQMGYLKDFFMARPFWELKRDDALISKAGKEETSPIVAISQDRKFLVTYLPTGGNITLDTGKLSGEKIRGWWFNPRQNTAQLIGVFTKPNVKEFQAPGDGHNNDWVLVLEEASVDRPRIGTTYNQYEPKAE